MLENSSGYVAVHLAVGATASLLSILLVLGLKLKWFRARMTFEQKDTPTEMPYAGVYRSKFSSDFDSFDPPASSSYVSVPIEDQATLRAEHTNNVRATPGHGKATLPGFSPSTPGPGMTASQSSNQANAGSSQTVVMKSNIKNGTSTKKKEEKAKAPKVKEEKAKATKVKEEKVKAPKVKEVKAKPPKLSKEPKPKVEKPPKDPKGKAPKAPTAATVNGSVPKVKEIKESKKNGKSQTLATSRNSINLSQSTSEIASSNNNAFPYIQPSNGTSTRPQPQQLTDEYDDAFVFASSTYDEDPFNSGQARGMKTFGSMTPTKGQVSSSLSPIPQYETSKPKSLRNPIAAGSASYKPPRPIPGFADNDNVYIDMDDMVVKGEKQFFMGTEDESET